MPHRHSATRTINPVSVVWEDFVVMAGMPDAKVDSFRWPYFQVNLPREVLTARRTRDAWVAFWPVVWLREPSILPVHHPLLLEDGPLAVEDLPLLVCPRDPPRDEVEVSDSVSTGYLQRLDSPQFVARPKAYCLPPRPRVLLRAVSQPRG